LLLPYVDNLLINSVPCAMVEYLLTVCIYTL
jgi:hypothetical protein